jgi:hypothetical protein
MKCGVRFSQSDKKGVHDSQNITVHHEALQKVPAIIDSCVSRFINRLQQIESMFEC